ncbi:SWIRM domain-containing protein [Entamoeba marina]
MDKHPSYNGYPPPRHFSSLGYPQFKDSVDRRKKVIGQMFTGFKEINPSCIFNAKKSKKRPQPMHMEYNASRLHPNPFDMSYESKIPTRSCFVESTETETSTEPSEFSIKTNTTTSSVHIDFDPARIQQIEMDENPEFFMGRSTKTPERYFMIRNAIVDMWNREKPKYISKTMVRNTIKNCGDVNSIGRIHHFLEKMQWINSGKVVGRYIRDKHTQKFKQMESVNMKDDTHIIMYGSALIILDMHCRLIGNPVGLIVGKQVTPLLFLIDDMVPIGVGKCDLPEDTRVIGFYYDEGNHFPEYLEASYPFWILKLVWKRKNCTFSILRKDKQMEVGVVEIVKKDDIRKTFECSPVVVSLFNAYIQQKLCC